MENGKLYVRSTLVQRENPDYDEKDPDSSKVIFVVQNYPKSFRRYVPMNEKAKGLISEHNRLGEYTEPGDFVICTRNRKNTTPKNANDTIKAIQKQAGTKMQNASSHVIRHTFASLMYKQGIGTEIIAAIMGNSPEVMRKTYLHFEEHRKYDAVELLAKGKLEY